MAGRMGGHQVTTLNLEVVQADAERELILVRGAVPGPRAAWSSCATPSRAPTGWPVMTAADRRRPPPVGSAAAIRPEPERRTVERRRIDGTVIDTVDPRPRDLRHRAQHGRAPPGDHGPAGGGPGRHPVDPHPGRGAPAVAPSPSGRRARPGPPGLDPVPAVVGRWRGPRPQAPLVPPAHPQEDDPPGPVLGPVGPGRRGQGGRRRRVVVPGPEDQGRRGRPGRARSSRAGARGARPRRRHRRPFLRQPARRPDHAGRASSTPTTCSSSDWVVFTDATLPGETTPAPVRSPAGRAARPRRAPAKRTAATAASRRRQRRRPPKATATEDRRRRGRRPPRPTSADAEADSAADASRRRRDGSDA